MERQVRLTLCVVLVLCCLNGFESRRTSGGGRRTSSSSSSSWSRPKPASKPHTNYGFSASDNRKLSYGHDTVQAPKPAPKPSAPVLDHHPAPNSQNIGWNTQNIGQGTNQANKNIGWNVGQTSGQSPVQTPVQTPGQAPGLKPTFTSGWSVWKNQQTGFNQPKPGQVPPPYSPTNNQGFATQHHQTPVGAPPPYPGLGTQQHSHMGNAPPPYPGLGNQQHSQFGNAPPPYSGYGNQHQAPPPYSGYNNQHSQFGSTGYNQPHYPQQSYPNQQFPGYQPGYGQGLGSPGYGGGFGSPGFGGGGFGGGGFGGGGFGGGGFGGGYSPYNQNNGAFGYGKQSSGFGGVGSHLGTLLAGMMIWNLAKGSGSNYHVYHHYANNPTSSGGAYGQNTNQINVTHSFETPNEAKMAMDFGNMTCVTIYSAERFAKWANKTIKSIEYQTKKAFPFGNFNLSANQTGQIQFNFTIEPGRIVRNETVSITCCGTEGAATDLDSITNGKSPTANCVHYAAAVPFRNVRVVPLNVTLNVTSQNSTMNATMVNSTMANTTMVNATMVNTTMVNGTMVNSTMVNSTMTTPTADGMVNTTTVSPSNTTDTNNNSTEKTIITTTLIYETTLLNNATKNEEPVVTTMPTTTTNSTS